MLGMLKRRRKLGEKLREARVELGLMRCLLASSDSARVEAESQSRALEAQNRSLRDEINDLHEFARRQAARIEELEQQLTDAAAIFAATA